MNAEIITGVIVGMREGFVGVAAFLLLISCILMILLDRRINEVKKLKKTITRLKNKLVRYT